MPTTKSLPSNLRLGTRRSPLALAQSLSVARRLEELHPGLNVELVGIETRGDQILDAPLHTIPGREFFVAELDQALLDGRVDFTVHSFKDISLERPPGLSLAAVPERANPHDILILGPSAPRRLNASLPLRIGTGSPRRSANLAEFLPDALPGPSRATPPEFIPIRGNIDTRLSRIHLPDADDRHLDAVVLALAGISRLWASAEGPGRLGPLLSGTRRMVLPLRECPSAPAQGALAIECRVNAADVLERLRAMHHPETARHVARERAVLSEWGGGCQLALGATSFSAPDIGDLLFIRGRKPDGTKVFETRGNLPTSATMATFPSPSSPIPESWTRDVPEWFVHARQGRWVEGSAEGFGNEYLGSVRLEPVLIFTHAPPETCQSILNRG